MMTTAEYKSCRDQLLENQNPFLVLSKEEIMAEHDNIYRIGDMSITVTPYVQDTIDKLIGFTPHQRKGLKEAFGDSAMNRFRNSLAMATCVEKPQRFALIANPQGLSVDGIVPIKKDAIPMRTFFDVLEMFADKHGYGIEQIENSSNGIYGLTIRLLPVQAQYDVFFDDDEFINNGYYMKWNLGEMEIGNYYMRLVCTNGAVQPVEHALGRIHRIDSGQINQFINSPQNSLMISRNLANLKNAARQAHETPASLSELNCAKKLLTRYGAPEDLAEQLMPYSKLLDLYAEAGYDSRNFNTAQAKSNIMMWDVFNELTDFASHTPLWQADDNRRSSLMQDSMKLLQRKRDIRPYYDIFTE